MSYKIIRGYQNSYDRRVIEHGLTLDEARDHCRDPESSSRTCTTAAKKAITRKQAAKELGISDPTLRRILDGHLTATRRKLVADGERAALVV